MMNTMMSSGPAFEHTMPWLIRLLGGRWRDGRREYRMRWGSLSWRPGLALALCLFEEGFSLHVHAFRVNVFVRLPFLRRFAYEPHEIMESWGVSTCDGTLHLNWGRRTKVIWLPWRTWERVADDVRRADGSWTTKVYSCEVRSPGDTRDVDHRGKPWKEPDGRHEERYPYRYLLRSGEVQERTATIHVTRDTRRLKLFTWTSLFDRVRYYIEVEFSDEVGERSGSWKGGCIGCSYEMRADETPRECLKRMEAERKF